MNKWMDIVMDDGWVHLVAKTHALFIGNLWWNIIMGNWELDEKKNHVVNHNNLQSFCFYKECKVGLAFTVGDTKHHIIDEPVWVWEN